MRIVFFDTETTGLIDLNPEAEIIEYASAVWDDGEVSDEYHRYVWPGKPPSEEAARINGFDAKRWKDCGAIRFNAEDLRQLRSRLGGQLMGGSNPGFDQAMVRAEFERLKQEPPKWSHRKLDTNALGYPLLALGVVEKTSLVTLAAHFGIAHEAHTAMGDVRASIAVWEALYDLYIYRPKVMREALVEIADQAAKDADAELEEYARNASEGIET